MHAAEREELILAMLTPKGFVSFSELERNVGGSPATIRRDLERMASEGLLRRVRGGIKASNNANGPTEARAGFHLSGVPFHENIGLNRPEKEVIGQAAAELCAVGEAVMIDGGSTTLHMCPHLAGLGLSVLTNSLHIVSALIGQTGTQIMLSGGAVFPEQSIVLSVFGEDTMPRVHAPKLFLGAASLGPAGLMQADPILVAAERRLLDRAEKVIVLADASKFEGASGHVVCSLSEIDILVTDSRISDRDLDTVRAAGAEVIVRRPVETSERNKS